MPGFRNMPVPKALYRSRCSVTRVARFHAVNIYIVADIK
mgnify:FL=1